MQSILQLGDKVFYAVVNPFTNDKGETRYEATLGRYHYFRTGEWVFPIDCDIDIELIMDNAEAMGVPKTIVPKDWQSPDECLRFLKEWVFKYNDRIV